MDAHIDGGTVGLLALDALDVDAELLTVALHHLADLEGWIQPLQNSSSGVQSRFSVPAVPCSVP